MNEYGKAAGKGVAQGMGRQIGIVIVTLLLGGGLVGIGVASSDDDDDGSQWQPQTTQVEEDD